MRSIPDGIVLESMPSDFDVFISDDGRILRSTIVLDGLTYEIGLRPLRAVIALEQAKSDICDSIWQLKELSRIGRPDLMKYALVGRGRKS